MERRYAAGSLQHFAAHALRWAGARGEDANLVAEGLTAADLRGVHSHGVVRTRIYVLRLKHGSINANGSLRVVHDAGPLVLADAGDGLGIAMAARAMDMAIQRAQLHGVGVVGVRNSSHCGMLAWPTMRAVRMKMIGIAMSNADAKVAPWGARTKYLGTNPIAIAIPTAHEPPIILDMATSFVAHGRIVAAAARGETIPAGWAVDGDGRMTTDPHQALQGALLPFGGAKGSGLALIIDVLAGLWTGALSGPMITPLYQQLDRAQGLGHLFVAFSVEAFTDLKGFTERVDRFIRDIRSLPPADGHTRVYLPGEIEHLRTIEYQERGIPLPPDVVAEIQRVAGEIGIAAPVGS